MTMMNKQSLPVCVVGLAGGSAEGIAVSLVAQGTPVSVVLDRPPYSPVLQNYASDKKIQCYFGDPRNDLNVFRGDNNQKSDISRAMNGNYLIVVGDEGSDDLRDDDSNEMVNVMFDTCAKSLTNNIPGIVVASSVESEKEASGLVKVFKKTASASFKSWCEEQSKPFSRFTYGKLTGGVPGAEPLPFMGLPTIEPELHPSVKLNGVVLTSSDSDYATDELCTRKALSDTISLQMKRNENVDALVMSISGSVPTEREWAQAFNRVSLGSKDVEVLRVDFLDIPKPQALKNWIIDSWFPQALIDADAATKLAGARPVRAIKDLNNENIINIVWEDLQPDLTTLRVGQIQVNIDDNEKSLIATRIAAKSLPGEMQLMDKLVEGINKNVYKKKIATKLE